MNAEHQMTPLPEIGASPSPSKADSQTGNVPNPPSVERLQEIIESLEMCLDRKDLEIDGINEHMDHVVGLYYETMEETGRQYAQIQRLKEQLRDTHDQLRDTQDQLKDTEDQLRDAHDQLHQRQQDYDSISLESGATDLELSEIVASDTEEPEGDDIQEEQQEESLTYRKPYPDVATLRQSLSAIEIPTNSQREADYLQTQVIDHPPVISQLPAPNVTARTRRHQRQVISSCQDLSGKIHPVLYRRQTKTGAKDEGNGQTTTKQDDLSENPQPDQHGNRSLDQDHPNGQYSEKQDQKDASLENTTTVDDDWEYVTSDAESYSMSRDSLSSSESQGSSDSSVRSSTSRESSESQDLNSHPSSSTSVQTVHEQNEHETQSGTKPSPLPRTTSPLKKSPRASAAGSPARDQPSPAPRLNTPKYSAKFPEMRSPNLHMTTHSQSLTSNTILSPKLSGQEPALSVDLSRMPPRSPVKPPSRHQRPTPSPRLTKSRLSPIMSRDNLYIHTSPMMAPRTPSPHISSMMAPRTPSPHISSMMAPRTRTPLGSEQGDTSPVLAHKENNGQVVKDLLDKLLSQIGGNPEKT